MSELDEPILPDDYPVHYDYWYLADGKPIRSPLGGGLTVFDLKRELKANEIRRCDFVERLARMTTKEKTT